MSDSDHDSSDEEKKTETKPKKPECDTLLDALDVDYDSVPQPERARIVQFLKQTAQTLHSISEGHFPQLEYELISVVKATDGAASKATDSFSTLIPPLSKALSEIPQPADPDAFVTRQDMYQMELRLVALIKKAFL